MLEQKIKCLINGENKELNLQMDNLLPNSEETKKLVELLCTLLEMNKEINKEISSETNSKKENKKRVLITTEILTAILLLLTHLTKEYKNAPVVLNSGIIRQIFELKQIKGAKSSIPLGLFAKLVFNLFESPEMIEMYMERIISSVLFAKIQWCEKGKKIPEIGRAHV